MTLYDVLELTDKEITVWDKDYDVEVYFYGIKSQKKPMDKWTKAELELAKLLDVIEISNGVTVNLAEVIERKMTEIKKAKLFIGNEIDFIMDDIMNILAGYVSDSWLTKFVNALKSGEENKK